MGEPRSPSLCSVVCVCANQTRTAYLISGYDTLHINDHNLPSQPVVHSVGWFQNRGNMWLSRRSESTLGGHASAALLCTRSEIRQQTLAVTAAS